MRNQRRQLVGFARQHKVGTGYGVDQLLSRQLITKRLRVLIRRHPHLINNTAEALVIKFAIRLESLGLEDSLLHLVVADVETQLAGILIEQRLVNQTVQHLLTHGLHVIFIGRQF